MGGFFAELAKKLAERWVTLLVVPGVLLGAAAWVAWHLGQAHALDWTRLNGELTAAVAGIARQPGATQAVLAVAAVLVVIGVGLAVQAVAGVTRVLWLGPWPGPFAPLERRLVAGRRDRWRRRLEARRQLENRYRQGRTPAQQEEIDAAAGRVNRMALALPGRATWMGDRVHGVERVALDRYGLDLAFGWARLWLVLPETVRAEITAAHTAFAAAVATGTWAWPYLALAAFWWPSGLIALGIGLTGWARARSAIADLAELSESAVDLHGRTLATALGVSSPGTASPLTVAEGKAVTSLIRKGR